MKETKFELKYTEPCIHDTDKEFEYLGDTMNSSPSRIYKNANDDWERWSIPVGCGYFGANIFGRTDTERITVAEKTLSTSVVKGSSQPHLIGGLNTFSDIRINFGHEYEKVKNYKRTLDLETGIAYVDYEYLNVKYHREYFTSYPDRLLVIYLSCDDETGHSFDFCPIVPWTEEYMNVPNDGHGKSGKIKAEIAGNEGNMELSGKLETYGIDFCGLFKVFTCEGGSLSKKEYTDETGKTWDSISVKNAKRAFIILTLDTTYILEPEVFTSPQDAKPTSFRTYKEAYEKVSGYLENVLKKLEGKEFDEKYEILKETHLKDYTSLYKRVSLDLDFECEDTEKPTDILLEEYKSGKRSKYLEALYFQYGRYLLISSSRKGGLPAHLQGTWNKYRQPMWTSGYWHNINIQMNYWPAFVTNLKETFESYIDFNSAYMKAAKSYADEYVLSDNPEQYGKDGGNGWCIGTGNWPSKITGDRSAGNLGFTTQLFWEYYEFTKNREILEKIVYPVLTDAARYITKCVKQDEDGHYLVQYCDSPEQYVDGVWYYTKGTAYAQTFAYLNNLHVLECAKLLDVDLSDENNPDYGILRTINDQIDKYDPIIVGLSGQVKEFRQEKHYGDMGEYTHRHISNLVGLYPGDLISSKNPAWLDASKVTLTNRGDKATGWGVAHRLNLWARTKNGNRTYMLLKQLLENNTAPNLWDLHPPFQIDGNLGGCAGIAEMLIQSHEGYIHVLPAIPKEWEKGSFEGLVARGNFVVDCAWNENEITDLKVKSNAGEECKILSENAKNIIVKDENGNEISFNVYEGIVSFETEKNKTYYISGITKIVRPDKPENFEFVSENGNIKLSWTKENGRKYRVYRAYDSESEYTKICETEDCLFIDTPDWGRRITYALTSLDCDLNESERSFVYIEN